MTTTTTETTVRTMYPSHHLTHKTTGETRNVSFGVTDRFGREIGCVVKTCEVEYVPVTEEYKDEHASYAIANPVWYNQIRDNCGSDTPPGRYFAWYGQATRAGAEYGATQDWHNCPTAAARDIAIAKYLKSAETRGKKNAGK